MGLTVDSVSEPYQKPLIPDNNKSKNKKVDTTTGQQKPNNQAESPKRIAFAGENHEGSSNELPEQDTNEPDYYQLGKLVKKPAIEFDLGLGWGLGYYNIISPDTNGWLATINPHLGVAVNLSKKIKAGYSFGYSFAKINGNHSFHSLDHKLGMSYDVLHSLPIGRRRYPAFELNLGGGVLLKNVYLTGDSPTSKSFNIGGFASAELGLVMWNVFIPQYITLIWVGWTKIFLETTVSTGKDVTDFIFLAGGKFSFGIL